MTPARTRAIAMWSGPRNISTAMMRAWENRPDCAVVDEPFYACYLAETGLNHPCRDAILMSQSTDRATVAHALSHDAPAPVYYQKHMTHHMPQGCDLSWALGIQHAFLIRNPAEIIASYLEKMPSVTEADIGIVRQAQLFEEITALTGCQPPVIDSNDVLRDPAGTLERLCNALEVPWISGAMTEWPAGPRDSDGVWAEHWYQVVWASKGFAPYKPRSPELSGEALRLAEAMAPYYEAMARFKL